MNDPSIDGNENLTDIFVLCNNETEAPITTGHLEQKGYRVTLFSDSTHLLETLRFGKPNILICDSLSLGQEAYEVCRQIKADNEIWMVPVLILTSASSLADLLFVLDCNADNFIACPCDSSYLLSLIEGMLVTPVERQTPEQIKTQFKIQHDDHMFVVTADRRKLLEFLLSSFEIAVNKSDDLNRSGSENASLKRSVQKYLEAAAEQTRITGILNSTLQQKEQAITTLHVEQKEKEQQIAELSREKEFLVQERENNKSRIATMEEENRALLGEKEEAALAHGSQTAELRGQISLLEGELTTTKADLATTRKTLDRETTRREDAETSLGELVPQKEQAEKSVRALTLECEQARSASSAEKNRAQAAEQEIKSLLQAKTQSEQDLTRIIDDLKDTAKQQAAELTRFRDERVADKNRISSLETAAATLAADKESAECSQKQIADDLKREVCDLHASIAATTAALEEKNRQFSLLEQTCHEHKTAGQQLQEHASSIKTEFESVRSDLESRFAALVAEKAQAECSLKKTADDLKRELGDLRASFGEATAALEEKNRQYSSLEQSYGEQKSYGQQQLENINAIKTEIGTVRTALEQEKQQHASTVDSLQAVLRERDTALASLRGAHDNVKTDLDAHRDDLVQVKQELVVVSEDRTTLKSRLEESTAQIHRLEANLHAASADQAESDKQIRSLADELEQVKASLETERRQRRSSEENLKSTVTISEKSGEVLQQAIREQEHLHAMLLAERDESRQVKERARADGDAHERRIRQLQSELATATDRVHILEEQVQVTAREKREAEHKAATLANEIDQARTALADEWEDHMTAQERLDAAVEEKKQLEKSLQRTGELKTAASPAVIVRTSTLPATIPSSYRAVAIGQTPLVEPGVRPAAGVEDLFEDDEPARNNADELPSGTSIHVPAPEVAIPLPACSPDPEIANEGEETGEPGFAADDACESDEGDPIQEAVLEDDGDEDDSSGAATSSASRSGTPVMGFSFNRTQWFDLLKWAHHSGSLSQDQRLQIIRMGRLIQRGRRLTHKQDEQVREMIGLAQSLGYRFS